MFLFLVFLFCFVVVDGDDGGGGGFCLFVCLFDVCLFACFK